MLAVHLVTVRLLAAAWTAPEVSEEEGSYASRFYRWFLESFKSCLLLLVTLPGLIDTLAQLLAWRSLLWLSMTWRRRYLTQNYFLSILSLTWTLAFICFVEVKEWRLWPQVDCVQFTDQKLIFEVVCKNKKTCIFTNNCQGIHWWIDFLIFYTTRKVTGSYFNQMSLLVIIANLLHMNLKNEYKVKNTATITLILTSNKNPTSSLCFVHIFKLQGHESDSHY